ncbi:MAG TPA: glycerophosphodiester phosphodiesterase family protein [Acidimicrobiales bacterium]|nr:glycerophosphodiester phosphodiesterase family protein [Acidimicrobiales bacterium]
MQSHFPRARIHAHRGASVTRPENTLAAFNEARRLGADAIEFDVHSTLDGHLVVHHDYNLGQTTNGTGYVHESTFEYVRGLSAGAWFDADYRHEQVPTLDEVLTIEGISFELEVKGLPTRGLLDGVTAAVRRADVESHLEITGFHVVAVPYLRAELPRARFGLFAPKFETWMTVPLYEDIVCESAQTGGFEVVHIPASLFQIIDPEKFRSVGLLIHCGNVESEAELLAALQNADQVSTNDLAAAVAARQ